MTEGPLEPHESGSGVGVISLDQRQKMSARDRLRWLEKHGVVPEDADPTEWQMAGQTTWWGKPIESKLFWSGRPVWIDAGTQREVMRYGRRYPPIPDEAGSPAVDSEADVIGSLTMGDGPVLQLHHNAREIAFWDEFALTHPKPPAEIESEQRRAGVTYRGTQKLINLDSDNLERVKRTIREAPVNRGYPFEAFKEDALFWAYVFYQREQYASQIAPIAALRPSVASDWLARLDIDSELVTQSLTEEQLEAANDWKLRYLQRLVREKVDASYLDAYLNAWHFTRESLVEAQ